MQNTAFARLLCALAAAAVLPPPAAAQATGQREGLRFAVEGLRYGGNPAGSGINAANLVAEFYERRGFVPAWREDGKVGALLELIDDAFADGLTPGDYHRSEIERRRRELARRAVAPEEWASFELMLTDALVSLVHHRRLGKANPLDQHRSWSSRAPRAGPDTLALVEAALGAPSLVRFIGDRLARRPWYLRLRAALADYRRIESQGGWPAIPEGPRIEVGTPDPRVPLLARRLAITRDLGDPQPYPASATMDKTLGDAVRRFQLRHGLESDGVVGPATLRALNVPVDRRVQQLRLALERARWVQSELGTRFVVVNIAAFRVYVVADRRIVWESRVVVGKARQETPVFGGELQYIVFNPSWSVPYGIAARELLPEIQARPDWFETNVYEVRDAAGAQIDPASVDWSSLSPGNFDYTLVQPPGPDNALGQVKFIFPNEHAVYLHDTPARDLFATAERAFSHGCIRVEDPLALAEILLRPDGWDRARIDAAVAGGKTGTVHLGSPMPILLLYSTANADPDGTVYFYRDIYRRDTAVAEALDGPFGIP